MTDYTKIYGVIAKRLNTILESEGSNLEVTEQKVVKNNNTIHYGFVVRDKSKSQECAPTLYMEYSEILKYSDTELLDYLTDKYNSFKVDEVGVDITSGIHWEEVYPVLVNSCNKENFDREGVYYKHSESFEDLLVAFRVPTDIPKVEQSGSFLVHKKHFDYWDLSDNLEKHAMHNAYTRGSIEPMANILRDMVPPEMIAFIEIPMWVVTSYDRNYGAGCLESGGVQEDLINMISTSPFENEDIILIPSSVHEWIAVPESCGVANTETLAYMIGEVNHDHVPPEQVLSDHAYLLHPDCTIESL